MQRTHPSVTTLTVLIFLFAVGLALAGGLPAVAQVRQTAGRLAAPAGDAVMGLPCTEAEFDAALNTVIQTGGGTITFACGAIDTILFSGEKVIGLGITVDGARPGGRMRLSGHGARLFGVTADGSLTLRNLALIDGDAGADDGGAVFNYGALVITNSEISGNSGNFVGGVENWGAATLTNVDIHNNGSLGLSHHGGREAILTNVTVRSNGANGSSGLYNDAGAYLQMTGGAIQGNGNYGLNNAGTALDRCHHQRQPAGRRLERRHAHADRQRRQRPSQQRRGDLDQRHDQRQQRLRGEQQ